MPSLQNLPAWLTADEAAATLKLLASAFNLNDVPDVRTLRSWRTKKHLKVEGRQFTRRNILEVLAILKLRGEGQTLQSASTKVLALDEERLQQTLLGAPTLRVRTADDQASLTLELLAKGLVLQHQFVRRGAIVGHTDREKTSNIVSTPRVMQQAMAHLGRQYLEEKKEDQAASIHTLIQNCMTPLGDWAPDALARLEDGNVILVDPGQKVPSPECNEIATRSKGNSITDLRENQLHDELREILGGLGDDADFAYTTIREFIGRHPVASADELRLLIANPELSTDAVKYVQRLYSPVHASHAVKGMVRRCQHCHGLIKADDQCILEGCASERTTAVGTTLPLDQAFIANPEILMYWADPAREELRMYDELRKIRAIKDQVELYPHSDRCDVAVGEQIGVDVKDYRSPVNLAYTLNRKPSLLGEYPVRILAIADRRWDKLYGERLREKLRPEHRSLQVMNVTDAIKFIKKQVKGGADA